MIRPGKLRRALAINSSEALFELYISGDGVFTADQVGDVSISHGKESARGGLTVATMEARVQASLAGAPQRHAIFRLSQALAERITDGTGYSASTIRHRFTGRVGADTITDRGTGRSRYTDIQCSSWTSLLKNSKRTVAFYSEGSILASLRSAIAHPSFTAANIAPVNYPDTAHSDLSFELDPEVTFSDAVTKYGGDIGILIQQRRDGSISLLPITKRIEIMHSAVQSDWPILRSEALAPATWVQPVETASKQYTLLHVTSNDAVYRWLWPFPHGANPGVLVESEDVDWSNIRTITENYRHHMDALNHDTNAMRHTLQSVTVDILMLLRSGRRYDRIMVCQLLAMNEGDPIFMSGDWLPIVRGPHLVQGINETLNADEWKLQLSLTHPRNTFGIFGEEIPEVPPRVWDSATSAWDDTAGSWDSF